MSIPNIQFGEPAQGWMEVHLDGWEWQVVSDVPCDSIRHLIEALLRLLHGSTLECIDWFLEPDYAQWLFRQDGNQLSFFVKDDSRVEPVLCASNTAPKLIASFVDALAELEAFEFWKGDEDEHRVWSWPFPATELQQVRLTLADRRRCHGWQ